MFICEKMLYYAHAETFVYSIEQQWAFSLWHRQGKAFCVRQFALQRQQPETDKKNFVFTTSRKISADTHGGTSARQKHLGRFFFIKRFTLTMDQILIVLLKHI